MRLALAALASVALVWLTVVTGLEAFARTAERSGVVYPYKDEDWLRYLAPSLWPDDGAPMMMLAGPSTVRENLLIEDFAAVFPGMRIFQGGLSLGTLGDVRASLEYVARVYGTAALPEVLVLGTSPRFLADIPEERPFALGLDRYSRHYRVASGDGGAVTLEEKASLEGWFDRLRFTALKQQKRYWAALAWLGARVIGPDLSAWLSHGPAARYTLRSPVGRRLLPARVIELGIHEFGIEVASPYKYRGADPMPVDNLTAWLDDPGSWWQDVYRWDAGEHAADVRSSVHALRAFAQRHDIALYVVNLPERALSRRRYAPGVSRAYNDLLRDAFEGVPLLDLRCLLRDDEFYDAEHALEPGGRRMTERVIRFVHALRRGQGAAMTDTLAQPCSDLP